MSASPSQSQQPSLDKSSPFGHDVAGHNSTTAVRLQEVVTHKLWDGWCFLNRLNATKLGDLSRTQDNVHVERVKTSLRAAPFIYNQAIVLNVRNWAPGKNFLEVDCYGADVSIVGGNHTVLAVHSLVDQFPLDEQRYGWRPVMVMQNLTSEDIAWFGEELNKANSIHRSNTDISRLFIGRLLIENGVVSRDEGCFRTTLGKRWGWEPAAIASMFCYVCCLLYLLALARKPSVRHLIC